MISGIASLGRIGGCGGRDAKWWFVPTGFYSQFNVFNWKFSLKFQVDQFQQVHVKYFHTITRWNRWVRWPRATRSRNLPQGRRKLRYEKENHLFCDQSFIFSGVKGFKWAEKMPKNCQSPIQNKMTCDCFDCYNTVCFDQILTIMWYFYILLE